MNTPYTIRTMLAQLGTGLYGGICYCGGNYFVYKHPDYNQDRECRPDTPSRFADDRVNFDIGVSFDVNGKPGEDWKMAVTYEQDDTYSVWLWSKNGLLDSRDCVYWDALQSAVEQMYDKAIKKHNGGFIPC